MKPDFSFPKSLTPAALGLCLFLSSCWLSPGIEEKKPTNSSSTVTGSETPNKIKKENFVFEEPARTQIEDTGTHTPAEPAVPPIQRPRVAIIIDDMGYHPTIGRGLLNLDLNLSFAFLPHSPFAGELTEIAFQKKRDILVHIPMEALGKQWDPGPGAIYLDTPAKQKKIILQQDLAAIPHAIGANNHMGSKLTANRQAMHLVLTELKTKDLFFIDSFTTAKSTGMDEAQKMGIRTNRRDIFLDNVQKTNTICVQLDKLIKKAKKNHQAIAIGHPYRSTLEALKKCSGKLKQVKVVPVQDLIK
jgi:polysaccharide deacetylase 2 family uncharacterized protein YibQ